MAQTSVPLVTDRPDQTESAVTVAPGLVQVEMGLGFAHEAEGGTRLQTLAVPTTLVRIGLVDRLEARLGFAGWQRARERVGNETAGDDGFGDFAIGVKVRVVEEQAGRPQLAIVASTTLPTGTAGFGSGRADPTLLLAGSNTLSDRFSVGYNVGLRWTTARSENAAADSRVAGLYTLVLGFSVADGVGAFAEVFGSVGLERRASDPMALDGGLTFRVRDNVQFDVSGGFGLNAEADDVFVGAGIGIRIPR